jgi:hypothetical protein
MLGSARRAMNIFGLIRKVKYRSINSSQLSKVVIVSEASKGIGASIAKHLGAAMYHWTI